MTGVTIGSVDIPVVLGYERSRSAKVEQRTIADDSDAIVFVGPVEEESLSMDIAIVSPLLGNNEDIETKEEEVKSLLENDTSTNSFTYLELDGYFAVESVDFEEDSPYPTYREGTISGYYVEQIIDHTDI